MLEHIDHTCLRPDATEKDMERLCQEAEQYNFRGICVAPSNLWLVRDYPGIISTVIGFPTGAHTVEIKIGEIVGAACDGATEFDVVWNIGLFKEGKHLHLLNHLRRVVRAVEQHHVKVIVEECYLDVAERELAWKIVRDSGAWAIKTSTGFGPRGASLDTIHQWWTLGTDLKIKASGGIKTREQAKAFIAAGADIIGTSHGVSMQPR